MIFEIFTARVTYSPVPINGVVSLGSSAAPFLDEREVVETTGGCPPSLGGALGIPAMQSSAAPNSLQLLKSAALPGRVPCGTACVASLVLALEYRK